MLAVKHQARIIIGSLFIAGLLAACSTGASTSTPQPGGHGIGQRTKTSGCVAHNALPDSACSPGAIFADVTKDQVCVPGYSKGVRDVPDSVKNQVFAEYGIAAHGPGEYEVDHLISLE